MEYTSGASSWGKAVRRAIRVVRPRQIPQRQPGWSLGVPLIMLAAGLLFTTSANTADGTSLRDDRRLQLTQLIEERREQVAEYGKRAAELRAEVEQQTDQMASSDVPIAQQRGRADSYRSGAGFTAVHGPGMTVRLDDAPRRPDGSRPEGVLNDDLVVHQQDVQAVVNALWAGGAEAMSIMDVRVISTSAVRCVGNTLLLNGRVYSPPFTVRAIGDPDAMRQELNASEGVQAFREAATEVGLGYRETVEQDILVPAHDGAATLRNAQMPR